MGAEFDSSTLYLPAFPHCSWPIQQISRDNGVTVLIVEQKVRKVLKIARRVCVLRNGRVSFTGPAEELKDEKKLKQVYL